MSPNVNDVLSPLSRVDLAILEPVAFGTNGVYSVVPQYNAVTGAGGPDRRSPDV